MFPYIIIPKQRKSSSIQLFTSRLRKVLGGPGGRMILVMKEYRKMTKRLKLGRSIINILFIINKGWGWRDQSMAKDSSTSSQSIGRIISAGGRPILGVKEIFNEHVTA